MAAVEPRRRLIVNADDFGRSGGINRSVIEAHQHGILTTASLMVAGEAFEEAVALARENPRLGVGLHLTLCCGKAGSAPGEIPNLANSNGEFSASPVWAGMKYFFSARARLELAREIAAQLARFSSTGLTLDHVNGHLHFHLHPTVFSLLAAMFAEFRVKALRLTRSPLRIDWPLGSGRYSYRLSHAAIFSLLSHWAGPQLRRSGIKHTGQVFGLLENDRITEGYILKLLRALPPGDSELYAHPSLDQLKPAHFAEHQALMSEEVRSAIAEQNIELIRYQDL